MSVALKEDPLATRTRRRSPVVSELLLEQAVALTILAHPDARRVGERLVCLGLDAGEAVALTRLAPLFAPPKGSAVAPSERPLADPFLSREPLASIVNEAGATAVVRGAARGCVRVEGEDLDGSRPLSSAEIERGVTIELDDRVALLLHRVTISGGRAPPRFDFVGESDALRQLRREIERVARTNLRVLVRGATGSGKELAARAIHLASACAAGPFEAINMAAVQPSLAASARHVRGAFSGAVSDHEGHFVAADGGTLFLDEVGDTDASVQAMLLRTLETKEVVRVGDRKPRSVNVRFLAATDADLETAVAAGRFREPLLHRIAEATLRVPSLAERRDDIGRLIVHFARGLLDAEEQARLLDDASAETPWLDAGVVARLARAPWTGNVRQLQNVVRQLVIHHRHEPTLSLSRELEALLAAGPRARDEPGDAADRFAVRAAAKPEPGAGPTRAARKGRRVQDIHDDEILAALEATGFRRRAAADRSGLM